MHPKTPTAVISAILLLAAGGVQAASPEISRGALLASTCFTCHGTDGKSPGSIPSIQGIPATTLAETMKAFRTGERPSTVMDRHAKGYSDEEIALLADYLSRTR